MAKKRSNYENYIPWFRKEVYPPFAGNPNEYKERLYVWIIFSSLEKLKKPRSCKYFKLYENEYSKKKRPLRGTDFELGGTVFVVDFPKKVEGDIEKEYNTERAIDEYLKRFFITKPPDKTMRERIIQDFFIIKLLKEGYTPKREVQVKKGRIDVLFEKEGRLTAVEIKRGHDDNAVDQLTDYIRKCKQIIR